MNFFTTLSPYNQPDSIQQRPASVDPPSVYSIHSYMRIRSR